jgi:hypothetical protein
MAKSMTALNIEIRTKSDFLTCEPPIFIADQWILQCHLGMYLVCYFYHNRSLVSTRPRTIPTPRFDFKKLGLTPVKD